MRCINYSLIVLLTMLLSGCALKPTESQWVGACKELLIEHKIWDGSEQASMGTTLLAPSDVESIFWRKQIIGLLPPGTQVRIAHIYQDWNGSWGHFLRIEVEVLEGEFRGLIAEVPSIAPHHPRPRWILAWVSDPDALQFNPELLKECPAPAVHTAGAGKRLFV
ncbi:hypothetical protein CWE08_10320 [Aliidiomarina iranensis]|uniref:DUF3750 domain-containing protein n=2 Tax=Aliidiomarina iranensis TaxID=1434071 RepID=A0A432VRL0_9GAMM|nr:hypothetical protein CWE08_10320 [Aliidiomarina iranensis]